jgi:hypothetical protein
LPGQAGGIVTLIFDLVTLSYRAPACPANLTRPRALRSSVMRHCTSTTPVISKKDNEIFFTADILKDLYCHSVWSQILIFCYTNLASLAFLKV